MLKNLTLTNFTAFSKAELNFSKGINVIIGRNGVGKSHLLKVGYSFLFSKAKEIKTDPNHFFLAKIIYSFNISLNNLHHLIRQPQTASDIELKATISAINGDIVESATTFIPSDEPETLAYKTAMGTIGIYAQPTYIPPKEILSIYPGLAQAIEDRELSFDGTYHDLAKALGRRPLKGKRLAEISDILLTIEEDVFGGGKFVEKNSQFYFEKESIGELEAPLVAEGLCKVGMLAHLLRNGSLVKGSTLFWDEPESNLNPQLLKLVAKAMTSLADYGIQVVVATHSLFLMRELDILSKNKSTPLRFFGLSETPTGVEVSQGDSIENIDHIQSLEEELEQTDRYLSLEYVDD